MRRRHFIESTTAASLALLPLWSGEALWLGRSPPRAASLLLKGGTVYDGTGASPVQADIALEGNRVVGMGPGLSAAGAEDARIVFLPGQTLKKVRQTFRRDAGFLQ